MSKYDVELFAGPGGWDVAARLLRIFTVGFEWDLSACQTAIMAGFVRVKMDVALAKPWELFANGIRLLIASPPCQAFSAAGKGKGRAGIEIILEGVRRIGEGEDPTAVIRWVDDQMEDDRAALVLEPLRWAIACNPETIALEQVPAVLPVWQAYAEVLRELGYSVAVGILQAEQYGVPQTRKRAILIARLDSEALMPLPTHSKYYSHDPTKLDDGVRKWVSMAEALGWTAGCPEAMRRNSGPGAARDPRSVDAPSYTIRAQGSGSHPSGVEWVYRGSNQANAATRPLDTPAPTVNFGARSNNKVEWMPTKTASDPTASRVRVTVQEAAVLQSFPADYPWQGNKGQQHRQVGDAMPPPLAWHVLRAAFGLPAQHYPGTEEL